MANGLAHSPSLVRAAVVLMSPLGD
jgi:hypothetical protein